MSKKINLKSLKPEDRKHLDIMLQLHRNEAVLQAILNRLDNLNGHSDTNRKESVDYFEKIMAPFEEKIKNWTF